MFPPLPPTPDCQSWVEQTSVEIFISSLKRPTHLGGGGQQAEGVRGQIYGHVAICLVRLRTTKRLEDTDFLPIDLPLCRGRRSGEGGGSAAMCFYGVMVVVCPTCDLCLVTEEKTNICSFSMGSKSRGTTCEVPVH